VRCGRVGRKGSLGGVGDSAAAQATSCGAHLYRLAEAHFVAEEYSSVPSLDGGGHSLALKREQCVLERH